MIKNFWPSRNYANMLYFFWSTALSTIPNVDMNSGATLRNEWVIEAGKSLADKGEKAYIWVSPKSYALVLTKLFMDKNETCYMNFNWDANDSLGVNDILVWTWRLLFIEVPQNSNATAEQIEGCTGVRMSVAEFLNMLKNKMG